MALGCVRGESDIVEAFGIVVVGGVSSEGGVVVLSAVSVGMVGEGVVGMVGVVGFAMLAAFGVVMVGVEVGERVGEGGFAMLSAVGVVVVGVGVEEVVGEGGVHYAGSGWLRHGRCGNQRGGRRGWVSYAGVS